MYTDAAMSVPSLYVEQQKFQAAIQSLTVELQQHPQNLNALNLLGIALTGAGQPQKANARFKQALDINPHFYRGAKKPRHQRVRYETLR